LSLLQEVHEEAQNTPLMRENLNSISTKSVISDEIETQKKALAAAQRKLDRMEQGILLIRENIAGLRDEFAEVKNSTGKAVPGKRRAP
jgi:hypothetical protein